MGWITNLELPLAENRNTGWNIFNVFQGPTPSMKHFGSHVSVLSAGSTPHPLHEHEEEEIIVMLSGQMDIVTQGGSHSQATARRISPGSLVYHQARQRHTINSVGPGPSTYLIFKWLGEPDSRRGGTLGSSIFAIPDGETEHAKSPVEGLVCVPVIDSPTLYLRKLQCHMSTLIPGAGYAPHSDPYDVAIVMMSGTVETLGEQAGPHDVIFYRAGEPHGMMNLGSVPARYLAFEFHGDGAGQKKRSLVRTWAALFSRMSRMPS